MSNDEVRRLDPCGCCEGAAPAPVHYNRPGLPALVYRIGTHATFLERMLSSLHGEKIRSGENEGTCPLEKVSARANEDPMAGFLDAWACVGDVLTFYQERLSNEAYLRTATQRRSVLELARSIGYELAPGVAAGTHLAFTIEEPQQGGDGEKPVEDTSATIPKGTQVQSIPGEGELPLTFETSEGFVAWSKWNELRLYLTEPQVLEADSSSIYLSGIGWNLTPGDLLLLVPTAGAQLGAALHRIVSVSEDPEADETLVETSLAQEEHVELATDTRSRGEWSAPPDTGMRSVEVSPLIPFETGAGEVVELTNSIGEDVLRTWIDMKLLSLADVLAHLEVRLSWSAGYDVFVFRESVSFFGHNAPKWDSLPIGQRKKVDPYCEGPGIDDECTGDAADPAYKVPWDAEPVRIWDESQGDDVNGSDRPHYVDTCGVDAFLERTIDGLTPDGWVLIEGNTETSGSVRRLYCIDSIEESTVADFGLSSKCSGLRLKRLPESEERIEVEDEPGFLVRRTVTHVRSEKLDLQPRRPITASSSRTDGTLYDTECVSGSKKLSLQGVVDGLSVGQPIIIQGEVQDPEGTWMTEVLTLGEEPDHDMTDRYSSLLTFSEGLGADYVRDTVTLRANVVPATHGETVPEVLGSGSGAITNQAFKLAKPPLTYTAADTASGAESSLDVRVDGVLWEEASCFYGLAADRRSYIVRRNDDGTTRVIFGDGKEGARLPTGSENVTAEYRSGIGLDGELEEGRLTLLKTKPLGVRGAANPVPATGADDPESLADARENAPLRVLTLDRVVSIQDYEDFTRTYSGIGKCQATVVWNGTQKVVHITVASPSGEAVGESVRPNLLASLGDVRDPREQVVVEDFDSLRFVVEARLHIDSAYLWDTVKTEIEDSVTEAFSFEQRAFGQPVTAAELVALMHQVAGVVAVDLDDLCLYEDYPSSAGTALDWVLTAEKARYDLEEGMMRPAQLLLLAPSGVILTEVADD